MDFEPAAETAAPVQSLARPLSPPRVEEAGEPQQVAGADAAPVPTEKGRAASG
ncbi:hypothetical protein [Defluviimonas sp. SAOS-178_SWC]|uniref:hypothetical protein n=1 Tax=Defluviimonas sp. SAOS-178_SWC TaxID=3121287 RepID=UPI0032214004